MDAHLSGDMQRALARIPERQRAALLLAELHDLTGRRARGRPGGQPRRRPGAADPGAREPAPGAGRGTCSPKRPPTPTGNSMSPRGRDEAVRAGRAPPRDHWRRPTSAPAHLAAERLDAPLPRARRRGWRRIWPTAPPVARSPRRTRPTAWHCAACATTVSRPRRATCGHGRRPRSSANRRPAAHRRRHASRDRGAPRGRRSVCCPVSPSSPWSSGPRASPAGSSAVAASGRRDRPPPSIALASQAAPCRPRSRSAPAMSVGSARRRRRRSPTTSPTSTRSARMRAPAGLRPVRGRPRQAGRPSIATPRSSSSRRSTIRPSWSGRTRPAPTRSIVFAAADARPRRRPRADPAATPDRRNRADRDRPAASHGRDRALGPGRRVRPAGAVSTSAARRTDDRAPTAPARPGRPPWRSSPASRSSGRASAYSPDGAWFAFSARRPTGRPARTSTSGRSATLQARAADDGPRQRLRFVVRRPAFSAAGPSRRAARAPPSPARRQTRAAEPGPPSPSPPATRWRCQRQTRARPRADARVVPARPGDRPGAAARCRVAPGGRPVRLGSWPGRARSARDGLTAAPATGNLVIHPFHGPLESDVRRFEPSLAAGQPARAVPTGAPRRIDAPLASARSPGLPEPRSWPPGRSRTSTSAGTRPGRGWRSGWPTQSIPPLGRLSLFHFDPSPARRSPAGCPAGRDGPARLLDRVGRLAWATPPGQGGEGSRVQIVAWTDEVGAVESVPVEGAIVVH